MKKFFIILSILWIITGCAYLVKKPQNMNKMFKGDGYILREKIEHIPDNNYVVQNSNDSIRVFLRTKSNDIEECFILVKNNKIKMDYYTTKNGYDYFYGNIDNIENLKISYLFEVKDAKTVIYKGEKVSASKKEAGEIKYNLKNNEENIPAWVYNGIWYKIFIDRFRNGNIDNDPIFNQLGPEVFLEPNEKLTSGTLKKNLILETRWNKDKLDNFDVFKVNSFYSAWTKENEWEKNLKKNKLWYNNHYRHYGGDLQGIKEKIDYIKNNGFNVVVLSPVFYSYSNHKYDSFDFRHIDPTFGLIEQTGQFLGKGNNIYSKKGESEYILLEFNETTKTNGFGEKINDENIIWSESDLIACDLNREIHEKGMKIIYSVDITCVGRGFYPFIDYINNGPNSIYKDWFINKDWEKYSENNEDDWNPYIEYNGNSNYQVLIKGDKKFRRKWIKPLNSFDKESIEWNINNVSYYSWNGIKGIPLLNLKNLEVKQYIINSLKKWIKGYSDDGKDGIDGIIFLSAENINNSILKEIKNELKNVKKEVFIGAEVFVNKNIYFEDKIADGVINYKLMPNILKKFVNNDARYIIKNSEYKNNIMNEIIPVSNSIYNGIINLVDSEDTERIFSMTINPNRDFDYLNENKDGFKNIRPDLYDKKAVDILKIITGIQFTSKGVPAVYYGDEVGMWGGNDPYSRKPMLWKDEIEKYEKEEDDISKYRAVLTKFDKEVGVDETNGVIIYPQKVNEEIENWYKKLIKLRNSENNIFQKGKFKFIVSEDNSDILAFINFYNNEGVITVINLSNKNIDKEPELEVSLYVQYLKDKTLYDLETKDKFDIVDGKIKFKILKKSIKIFTTKKI